MVESGQAVGKRVLLVEDEWLIALEHASRLRDAGYEIVGPVPSVAAALGRLAEQAVDAAVLDVRLHGHDTFALGDALQARAIPFVFVTGVAREVLPARFSGRHVLQKPLATGVIETVLKGLLAAR